MRRRTGVAGGLVLTFGLLGGLAVLVLSDDAVEPTTAELTWQSSDGSDGDQLEVDSTPRRRVGAAPQAETREPNATIQEDDGGPETPEKRRRWILGWLEIATGSGYEFADLQRAERAVLTFDAAEAVPILLAYAKQQDGRGFASAKTLQIIGKFGEAAAPWIPDLVAMMRGEHELADSVRRALGEIGAPAAPALADLLDSRDPYLREQGLRGLGMMKTLSKKHGEAVLRFFDDRNVEVREIALRVFEKKRFDPSKVVPAVVDLLEDEEDDIRRYGVKLLGEYAGAAAPAVPALLEMLDDPERSIRNDALEALGNVGRAAGDVAGPALITRVETNPRAWLSRAPKAIARMGAPTVARAQRSKVVELRRAVLQHVPVATQEPARTYALDVLVAATRDPDARVRANAVFAIGRYQQLAAARLPDVLALVADVDDDVRVAAISTAVRLAPKDDAVVELLLEQLESGTDDARRNAAAFLGQTGRSASVLLLPLTKALDDRVEQVRMFAAIGIETLGESGAPAAADLARRLSDTSADVRVAAAIALIAVDPPGAAARDAVQKLRVDDSVTVRQRLVAGLGRHPDALWLPVVVDRLADRHRAVRGASISALAKFGERAQPHVSRLVECARTDKDGDVRILAIEALGELGPVAIDARSFLEQIVRDPVYGKAAALALERIVGKRHEG